MTRVPDNLILYKELSYNIIGAAMTVHRELGSMLPEHCYEGALEIELRALDIWVVRQKKFQVEYKGYRAGHFFTDMIVDDKIVLELKSEEAIYRHHESQIMSYLRVSGLRIGYILNFGQASLQFKRFLL